MSEEKSVCPQCWEEVSFPAESSIRCPVCHACVVTEEGKASPEEEEEAIAEQEKKGGMILYYGGALFLFSILCVVAIFVVKYLDQPSVQKKPYSSVKKSQEKKSLITKKYNEQIEIGKINLTTKDYRNAVLAFSKAIKISPSNPTAYTFRAIAFIELDNPVFSFEDCLKARRLAKHQPEYKEEDAFVVLCKYCKSQGDIYSNVKKHDLSHKWYQHAAFINPSDYESHLKSGLASIKQLHWYVGLSELEEAAKIDKRGNEALVKAYIASSLYYYALQDYKKSHEDYQAAFKINPTETKKNKKYLIKLFR